MDSVKPIGIKLKNNTHSNKVFAYVTGRDIDNNNRLVFLQANDTKSTEDATQSVVGLPADGLNKVIKGLKEQYNHEHKVGWNQFIINRNGKDLRAISPNIGITMNPNLFKGYYEGWVSQVWDKYKSEALIVDIGDQIGIVNGQVNSKDKMQFPSNITFSKPSTADIFSNYTGPFANQSGTDLSALVPILAAAFERSTLLNDSKTPDSIDQY